MSLRGTQRQSNPRKSTTWKIRDVTSFAMILCVDQVIYDVHYSAEAARHLTDLEL